MISKLYKNGNNDHGRIKQAKEAFLNEKFKKNPRRQWEKMGIGLSVM